ncbi:MAG TPA: FAD-binding oxidoreductase, partial [Firmicutes bacterium]|nr:FAD-binding oxidoreductase [Bacillota bacterium]
IHQIPELLRTLYARASEQSVSISGITRIARGTVNMYATVNPREDESVIRAGHFMEEMVEVAHDLHGLAMALHGVGIRRIDLLEHNRQQSDLEVLRSVRGVFTPTDAFSVPFVSPPAKERRDLRHRTAREPKIAAVRDAISAQLEHATAENESIQIQASSPQVLSQVLRAAGKHRVTTAIHDRPTGMAVDLSLSELKRVVAFDPDSRVVSVDGGMTLSALRDVVAKHGLWLPISPLIDRGTCVSDYLAWYRADSRSLGFGPMTGRVVELTAVAGRGDIFSSGGLAGMQHTGPRLSELCIGTRHRYAIITGAAFGLLPAPAMRATVQAEFLKATDADAAVQRWLGRTDESPKCRPSACCILIDAHYDEDASTHRQEIHAFTEFTGIQSGVERQVRWARHIADEAKAIDLHEAVDAESGESWWFARTHYRQWPGDRGDDVLHLVVWTGIAGWAELARKIRHVVQVHKYDCKLLIDLGAGRIDVLVAGGAVEPSPLVRLLSELVGRSNAMLEVWSSDLAGKWTGPVSPALETVRSDLKVNFDPSGVLPAGWGRKLVWSTPFESRRTSSTS